MLRSRWGIQYHQRVLETGPIGYWQLNEQQGTTAYDMVTAHGLAATRNGTHVGVTLGEPGIGDGNPSPLYDGALDYTNIYSLSFAPAELPLNPGFETAGGGGADIWANWVETAGDGALADEIVLFHTGAHAAKATAGATADTKVAQTMTVVPGQTYRLRFFTRGDGANGGRYGVYDVTNGVDIIPATATGVTGAVYTRVVTIFTAPPGCVSARLDLWCSTVNGGICYFDSCTCQNASGFNGDEMTVAGWAKVFNAGVWTDGVYRLGICLRADVDNRAYIYRTNTNGQLQWYYVASASGLTVNRSGLAETGWMHLGLTISAMANQMKAYYAGEQTGVTQTGLGTWTGPLAATSTCIGASSTTPTSPWYGYLAHWAVWNRALSAGEIASLAVVE